MTALVSATLILVFGLWADAAEDGRSLYDTGNIPRTSTGLFASHVDPAYVIPQGDDPLHVCDGSRVAILLGRADGVAQVFWLPTTKDPSAPREVLALPEDQYAVATGVARPMPCVK